MLNVTSEEKRCRAITNAHILHAQGDLQWFDVINQKIFKAIESKPDDREKIILRWVRSAESQNSNIVKDQILQLYDQRTNPEKDQGEVREPE